MGGYLAYAEYKDSEIEWLGKIPTSWNPIPLKFLVATRKGIAFKSSDFIDSGCKVVKASDIKNNTILNSAFFIDESLKSLFPKAILQKEEIVISTVGSNPDVKNSAVGQVGVVPEYLGESLLNQNTVVFTSKFSTSIQNRFLFYVLISTPYRDHLDLHAHGTANQASLNITDMLSFQIALPSIEEQRSIARFLDYKTAQIDALITKKETLLKKLAEKRTALISQAVTKGCDRTVPMKDSGIEWLGEIPAHWRIMHLKRALSSSDYGISDNLSASGIHPVLRMGNLQNEEITMDDVKYIDKVDPLLILKPNDILFNRTNSLDLVGKVALFRGSDKFEVTFASYLVRFRTNELADPEYLVFFLGREEVQKKASSMAWRAIGQANLNPNRYGYLGICLPPIKEQREILSYLKEKLNDLQQPIRKVQIAIAKLKEYRTALITNAVTGKIDVRDVILETEPMEAA